MASNSERSPSKIHLLGQYMKDHCLLQKKSNVLLKVVNTMTLAGEATLSLNELFDLLNFCTGYQRLKTSFGLSFLY